IRWCVAAIALYRSIFTCPAARPRPKRWFTAFCNCKRKSSVRIRAMTDSTEIVELPKTEIQLLSEHIAAKRSDKILSQILHGDELTIAVKRDLLVETIKFLRDDKKCAFNQLMDITAVDYPQNAERFEIVYHLLSLSKNHRIRVKTTTDEEVPIDTITDLYPTANWFEREVWDMYGVFFAGHPDPRRILTDYGF